MRAFLRSLLLGLKTYYREVIVIALICLAILLLLNVGYYFLSRDSDTCLVCHYLRPYYSAYSKSTHQEVACVACHPDRKYLMGKYALRYVTATFSSQPIARVEDQSCLNCHEGQTLDTDQPFERNITFNHNLHLQKPMRGVRLHCTTCHNHRTPGQYLSVDHQACYLCHFKGAARGQSQTGCQTCHGNPKQEVQHQGFMFNHQAFIDVGLNCGQCHVDVIRGDADVPPERCESCHIARTQHYKDFALIHDVHVRKQDLDCFRCHNGIEHGKFGMISSLEIRCENCHVKLHTPEKQMYFGAGGKGVPDVPSRMFLAQVSCDGCHKKEVGVGEVEFGAAARRTQRESCLQCHGKGYDLMLDDWLQITPLLLRTVEPNLKQTETALKNAKIRSGNVAEITAAVEEARYNFDFVRDGRTAHNVFYSLDLLHSVIGSLQTVRPALGLTAQMNLGPVLGKPDGYCNALCHGRLANPSDVPYEKAVFPHDLHARDLELACTACHPADKHRQAVISREECKTCHHAEYPIECGNCHWRQEEVYYGQSPTLNWKDQPDGMAAAQVPCEGCHDVKLPSSREVIAAQCAACHDDGYRGLLEEWAAEATFNREQLDVSLEEARRVLDEARLRGGKREDERKAIAEIADEAEYLARANPLHNYDAAMDRYAFLKQKLGEVRARLTDQNPQMNSRR